LRKKLLILLLLGLLTIGLGTGARSNEIAENYGFEKGLRLARILDRQFVFSFVSSSCPHCQDFKDNILSNQTVKNILEEHFVLSLVSIVSEFEIELPEKGKSQTWNLPRVWELRLLPRLTSSIPLIPV